MVYQEVCKNMRELVTLEVAQRLFPEARDYFSERLLYVGIDSEIRKIARVVFHADQSTHLRHVCNEIFYVLACEMMDVPR